MTSNCSTRPSSNASKVDDVNYALGDEAARLIQLSGMLPVSVLGILGNLLAIVSWHADQSENVATFLFEVLAAWDTMFLASLSASIFADIKGGNSRLDLAFVHVVALAQLSSVHVTLLIGFNRWLAVFRLHTANALLTPRRVRVTVVATFAWCVLLQSLDMAWTLSDDLHKHVKAFMFFTKKTVGFMLPLLLLIVFNGLLIVTINHNVTTDTQSQQKRRTTLLVVSISVCSLIVYPVGVFFQVLLEANFIFNSVSLCDVGCLVIIENVFLLLQAVNSGLTVVFYALFSSKFRMLFRRQLSRCQRCFRLFVHARNVEISLSNRLNNSEH